MIDTSRQQRHSRLLGKALIAAAITVPISLMSAATHAITFSSGEISGSFSTQLSLGSMWRMEGQDKDLLSPGNTNSKGKASSSVTDDGNLNFDNGDMISLLFKGRHDLALNYKNYGSFVRFRYWYDHELEEGDRPHGNSLNNYDADTQLDDSEFNDFAKSSGIELLDAYLYGSFDAGSIPLDIRLGRQVVSWGESTFIQNGVNAINPVDVSALRKPGSELKDALLPVGMLYAAAGLTNNLSIELFYQYEWEKTALDGCGNYFATNDVIADGCEILTGLSGPTDQEMANGNYLLGGLVPVAEPFVRRGNDIEPDDTGQYGIAVRYFAESLNSTEFGAYFLNYHSRTPFFSGVKATTNNNVPLLATIGIDLNVPLIGNDPRYIAEYPEDIKLYGLSFSTNIGTWAVSGEISHRPEMPIQINTTEIVHAIALGPQVAPWSQMVGIYNSTAPGGIIHGYDDQLDFTQVQFTFIKFFDQILGASRLSFAAEIGGNFIGSLPKTSQRRYGRSPTYGIGKFTDFDGAAVSATPATVTYTCDANPNPLLSVLPPNPQSQNCTDDGYITDTAWGYRLRASLDYSDLFAGINVKPKIAWKHDVEGYSPPPNFNEGSQALTLGVAADYLNRYTGEISYTQYSGGDYNTLNDRDFAAISFGASF